MKVLNGQKSVVLRKRVQLRFGFHHFLQGLVVLFVDTLQKHLVCVFVVLSLKLQLHKELKNKTKKNLNSCFERKNMNEETAFLRNVSLVLAHSVRYELDCEDERRLPGSSKVQIYTIV